MQAKLIIGAVVAILTAGGGWWLHNRIWQAGYSNMQAVHGKYLAKQKLDADNQAATARTIERRHNAITDKAKLDYGKVQRERDVALADAGIFRLCKVPGVLGEVRVPVATPAPGHSVPETPSPPAGADDTAALATSFRFSDAVQDRDQCIALMNWVREVGG